MTTRRLTAANCDFLQDLPISNGNDVYDGALCSIIELLARSMVAAEVAANDNRAPEKEVV